MILKGTLRVIGPFDKHIQPEDGRIICNVTSSSETWMRNFSPFFLGPVKLYGPYGAFNVENAWQYTKVYECHADKEKNPTEKYWDWAREGWAKERAVRYPMYKGARPLYSWWGGKKLGYIDARKQIYVPLYETAVYNSGYFESLVEYVRDALNDGMEVCFWDYDGFDHIKYNLTLEQVVDYPNRKMGHAFVLANMVQKALKSDG